MNIRCELVAEIDPGERGVEIVERKGGGHPDTICDAQLRKLKTYWRSDAAAG